MEIRYGAQQLQLIGMVAILTVITIVTVAFTMEQRSMVMEIAGINKMVEVDVSMEGTTTWVGLVTTFQRKEILYSISLVWVSLRDVLIFK